VVQRLLIEPLDGKQRERVFQLHLPAGVSWAKDCKVAELAGTYTFPGALIRNAMQVAVNRALAADPKKPQVTHSMLRKACHEQIRASLDEYAVRRKVSLTLSDLILPEEAMDDIEELFTAAKYRAHVLHNWGFDSKMTTGKGIVALFSGEPGTGKTLCATILANELDQQLYQISIPRVVSKWIGETEKNIERIFETARANHGMLLFDEADSLFAKRTKVESSVDRYSNMATNMLLQEIENFEGIVILTTNIEKNIDKAFRRRINFRVNFPFPEPEMREQIWRTLVPATCPVDPNTDWELLGKQYELSGGHIKNAVLRAAYQAAADEGALAFKHMEYAARQECKNAGRVFRAVGDYGELEF
jgi:SpoVK/Ycf46/Vps4 family AAA+-type ATPase